jgi:RNA polymerase sigma factor (sigma-70 family)
MPLTLALMARDRYIWTMETHAAPTPLSPPTGRGLPLALARLGDERLARLVARGNERAFAVLYERHHQVLYRYCRSIVRDDTDAQDALQSTFAGALVALRRSARDAPLRPWLFRIAHNEAVSLLRRRRPVVELSEAVPLTTPSAADRAFERDRLTSLVSDLGELGERQRSALVMRELSGLSHEEIALALGTSAGAAKQAIFEARQALLELGEGRAMACEEVRRKISDGDRRVLRTRRLRAHLRDCAGCADFAAAIPARRSDLQALAPPLAPLAASGVLAHLIGAGSGHGAGGTGWVLAGATGKSAGAALAVKAVVGVVILTTATVGVTSILKPAAHHRRAAVSTGAAGGRAPGVASPGKHAGGVIIGRHQPLPGGAAAASSHSHATLGRSVTAHGRGSSATHVSPATHRGRLRHQPVRHAPRSRRGAARSGAGGSRALAHRKSGSHAGAGASSGASGNTGQVPGAQARTQRESEAAASSTTATPAPPTPQRGSATG